MADAKAACIKWILEGRSYKLQYRKSNQYVRYCTNEKETKQILGYVDIDIEKLNALETKGPGVTSKNTIRWDDNNDLIIEKRIKKYFRY